MTRQEMVLPLDTEQCRLNVLNKEQWLALSGVAMLVLGTGAAPPPESPDFWQYIHSLGPVAHNIETGINFFTRDVAGRPIGAGFIFESLGIILDASQHKSAPLGVHAGRFAAGVVFLGIAENFHRFSNFNFTPPLVGAIIGLVARGYNDIKQYNTFDLGSLNDLFVRGLCAGSLAGAFFESGNPEFAAGLMLSTVFEYIFGQVSGPRK